MYVIIILFLIQYYLYITHHCQSLLYSDLPLSPFKKSNKIKTTYRYKVNDNKTFKCIYLSRVFYFCDLALMSLIAISRASWLTGILARKGFFHSWKFCFYYNITKFSIYNITFKKKIILLQSFAMLSYLILTDSR